MITLKGTKDGLSVYLEPGMSLEAARQEVTEKLEEAKSFFDGAAVVVQLVAESLTEFEQYLLQMEIKKLLNRTEVRFVTPEQPEQTEQPAVPEVPSGPADLLHRGTVRSGQRLCAQGNLVVLGDANPGSELIAGGSIVVMGALWGIAHAGLGGDRSAVVAAAMLQPSQIRIADVISRRPDDEEERLEFCPEIAEIRDGRIVVGRRM